MQKYQPLIGLLGTLPIFESAAKLMSFTKAAKVLGLSQPAVSRRISRLEHIIGVPVFHRDHNKIELTREGRLVLEAVDLGLGHLNNILARLAEELGIENSA